MVVFDSGPLISFARIGRFDLLKKIVREAMIPDAVYNEVVVEGKGQPDSIEVKNSDWIKVESIKERTGVEEIDLGPGETEAIILAEEKGATLIIDNPKGREEAKHRNLKLIGSLAILQEAKTQGYIFSVREELDKLMKTGFRISDKLRDLVLREASEKPIG